MPIDGAVTGVKAAAGAGVRKSVTTAESAAAGKNTAAAERMTGKKAGLPGCVM